MTATTSRRRRRGFTLVELLVAMALIIFIMVILTEAFTAGTGVFRTLKSQGDMQERLRIATSLLRDDLRQRPGVQLHFADIDPTLGTLPIGTSPTQGYFYIQQGAGSLNEGVDGYNVPSYRMNALPALAFTVHRKGNRPQDYYAARIPGSANYPNNPALTPFGPTELTLFNLPPTDYQMARPNANSTGLLQSQWAEIGYFLTPTGRNAGTNNPMPLFSLRRRTRVVLDTTTAATLSSGAIPATLWAGRYAEVSCLPSGNNLYFNSPADVVKPAPNAPPGQVMPVSLTKFDDPANPQGQADWAGDDLVLTDVISFNVRVLFQVNGQYQADFQDVTALNQVQGINPPTGTYNTGVNPYPINALEITLRVWDPKTSLARQVTIVQDM